MKRYLQGLLFLIVPAIACVSLWGFFSTDELFRKIVRYELYAFGAAGVAVSLIVAMAITWQSFRAAMFMLFKIDLRVRKNTDESGK